MKITENRPEPVHPPVESYTLVVSPEELACIAEFSRYYPTLDLPSQATFAAGRLLKLLPSNLPWNPGKCFLESK